MVDYGALKTECETDPNTLGLTTPFNAGADNEVAEKLNAVDAANGTFYNGVIPSYEIIDATVPSEWAALSADEKQRYQTLVSAGQVNSDNANIRDAFLAMFDAGTTTRDNLIALAQRDGSRAEALFGQGTTISAADIAKARNA